jgi:hypothetical protein
MTNTADIQMNEQGAMDKPAGEPRHVRTLLMVYLRVIAKPAGILLAALLLLNLALMFTSSNPIVEISYVGQICAPIVALVFGLAVPTIFMKDSIVAGVSCKKAIKTVMLVLLIVNLAMTALYCLLGLLCLPSAIAGDTLQGRFFPSPGSYVLHLWQGIAVMLFIDLMATSIGCLIAIVHVAHSITTTVITGVVVAFICVFAVSYFPTILYIYILHVGSLSTTFTSVVQTAIFVVLTVIYCISIVAFSRRLRIKL